LPAHYIITAVGLFSSSNMFFAVTPPVIVVHEMFAEVYDNMPMQKAVTNAGLPSFFCLLAKVTNVRNFFSDAARQGAALH
jgi:hypothetical protein